MIVGIVGLPGEGKTLLAVHLSRDYHVVAANFEILLEPDQEFVRVITHQDILNFFREYYLNPERRAALIVDEANVVMPARLWERLPVEFLYMLSQTRKRALDFIYTTQSFNRVDKVLREITTYVYKPRLFITNPFILMRVEQYIPGDILEDGISVEVYPVKTFWVFRNKEILSRYDTYSEVDFSAFLCSNCKKYTQRCITCGKSLAV